MTRTITAESSAVEVPNPTGPADDVEKSADDLAPPIPPWYTSVVLQAWAIGILLLAALFSVWYWSTEYDYVSPLVVAHPVDVAAALRDQVTTGALWPNLWATTYEAVVGFVAATVLALLVAFVFAFSEPLRMAVYPYLIIIQTFPKVAIAPLIIAAFGYGLTPKIVIAALMAFFPILVNAMVGLIEVSADQTNLMRILGASRLQRLRMLQIPNALSYILPGLKSAAVLTLIGVIVAEFVSSREGLGFAIQASTQAGTIAVTYALLIVLSIVGLSISLLLGLLSWSLRKYRQ